jgi:hypothetical protein
MQAGPRVAPCARELWPAPATLHSTLKKSTLSSKAPKSDRRSGADRRQVEQGPPGRRERRVSVEPRGPEVQDVELTPSEWASLNEFPPPTKSGA